MELVMTKKAPTRHIRQVLEPSIAKQEVKNITKLYGVIGWQVRTLIVNENGGIVHRIIAKKGARATIIVDLIEAKNESKTQLKKKRTPSPRPTPPKKLEQKTVTKESPPKTQKKLVIRESKQEATSPALQKPDLDMEEKIALLTYLERDETGIIPALIAEGALTLKEGGVRLKKWIDREKFLYVRKYFKKVGFKL